MKSVVITHFFNEELLLPYWLKHHVKLFDHGILVDYHSTDASCDIVRELAPHWDLRKSNDYLFRAEECDLNVMEIERNLGDCWKMVLSTTEFIFLDNLHNRLDYLQMEYPQQKIFAFGVVIMTDSLEEKDKPLTDEPLVLQRHHGYQAMETRPWRCIHCHPDGQYAIGRHGSVKYQWLIDSTKLLWFGWSPHCISRVRKPQIQLRVPITDLVYGRGLQHVLTRDEYEYYYDQQCRRGADLLADNDYRATFAAIKSSAS